MTRHYLEIFFSSVEPCCPNSKPSFSPPRADKGNPGRQPTTRQNVCICRRTRGRAVADRAGHNPHLPSEFPFDIRGQWGQHDVPTHLPFLYPPRKILNGSMIGPGHVMSSGRLWSIFRALLLLSCIQLHDRSERRFESK
jgi:hypothetical protein